MFPFQSGKIFTFGGVNHIEDNTRVSSVHSAWAKVPSLRDMCWEAVNHYQADLWTVRVDHLLEEGVPRDLINSLHGQAETAG